jgi:hypothetical protein
LDYFYTAAPARLRHSGRTIQHSQESIARLAQRYHLNAKTVAKWRKRTLVEDAPMGPRQPRSTVLTMEQEAMIVAFRQPTLLALDDCLYALQASIPHLTRSSLHRCPQRHGISRLPEVGGDKPTKKKFAKYAIGYFHVDIAEVQTEQGRLYLFVAIDRTSKFACAELHPDQTRTTALPIPTKVNRCRALRHPHHPDRQRHPVY